MTKQEAISKLKDILEEATETEHAVCYVTSEDAEALNMAIEALADSHRSKGKWLDIRLFTRHSLIVLQRCSECGFSGTLGSYNFCPNCGADMRGEEDANGE